MGRKAESPICAFHPDSGLDIPTTILSLAGVPFVGDVPVVVAGVVGVQALTINAASMITTIQINKAFFFNSIPLLFEFDRKVLIPDSLCETHNSHHLPAKNMKCIPDHTWRLVCPPGVVILNIPSPGNIAILI
jgi:hypothetical protein